ncbi:hypothetical protein AURDEDRAFT_176574 [Auricularia subglabra TFB-10046 SS5]|uniref:Uncharacterized protein n=1 Tax=Auricularia subglabra (strain TFB-10046 / SS5) TaxID=717982 RepID=J0WR28_AURST|nr:hypothetical protein AURDEDRAFT_176574 [Auricularia subglabra TFB-10046 SS5]
MPETSMGTEPALQAPQSMSSFERTLRTTVVPEGTNPSPQDEFFIKAMSAWGLEMDRRAEQRAQATTELFTKTAKALDRIADRLREWGIQPKPKDDGPKPDTGPPKIEVLAPDVLAPDALAPAEPTTEKGTFDSFTGRFNGVPRELYLNHGYEFKREHFMAIQDEVGFMEAFDDESLEEWRDRVFVTIANEVLKRFGGRKLGKKEPPVVKVEPLEDDLAWLQRNVDAVPEIQRHSVTWKNASIMREQTPGDQARLRRSESRFRTPVSAMRHVISAPVIEFTEPQKQNLAEADPLDARLLLHLYIFENAHINDVNTVKISLKVETVKYRGENDFSKLEDFLTTFVEFMEASGFTDEAGMARSHNVLSLMLAAEANKWFQDQKAVLLRQRQSWGLDQIFVGMRQRFIKITAKASALVAFETVRLGKGGVAELESDLKRAAQYLVEEPSDYQMRSQFMRALPHEFRQLMLKDGYSPEERSFDELLEKAANVEASALNSAATRRSAMRMAPRIEQSRTIARANTWSDRRQNDGTGDKPLPRVPGTDGRENRQYQYGHRADVSKPRDANRDTGRVRGNVGAVELDSDEILAAPAGVIDGSDEYALLEFDAGDLDMPELDPSQWVGNDEETTVLYGNMARIVDVGAQILSAAAQTKPMAPKMETRFRSATHEVTGTEPQPKRARASRKFFEGYVRIGDLRAHALVDTGTDTEMISSDFAKVAGVKTFKLDNPVALQMACIGSRSRINFGARLDMQIGHVVIKNKYLDVVNLDRYDLVLGLPFLWQTKAVLDFSGPGSMTVHGVKFDLAGSEFALSKGEDKAVASAAAQRK